MEPTVPNGAFGVGWMGAYWWREPQVGDIVMIRLAGDHVLFLKRVLAQPGDLVEFRHGELWVNGQPRPEPYVRWKWDWNSAPVRLGPNEYLVMGDRRDMPRSSHTGGVVQRDRIIGKLLWWFGTAHG
jgi:signal peptidase I